MLPSLGWQSWSPPYPSPLRLPRRDYSPVKEFATQPLKVKTFKGKLNYWCSWYALGYSPTPNQIMVQAKVIRDYNLEITHILLDDGWSESWLTSVTHSIHQLGFKVGLWYAPFTRHRSLTLPQNLDRLIESYKLNLLKLDFLYQPYFQLAHHPNPSHTLTALFDHLSSTFPRLTTIGCGVPFSDAVGWIDIIRLSKDTALPNPTPRLLNKLFYLHRVSMLAQKYQAWEKNKVFTPDPDVRMFSLDTQHTVSLWGKMDYQIKGIGDDLLSLTPSQLANARQWLNH